MIIPTLKQLRHVRRAARQLAAQLLPMVTVSPGLAPAQSMAVTSDWQSGVARQFDFWIGSWEVNLRTIQDDLTWKDSVRAHARIYPVLDGKAILELWDSPTIKGFSLRYYDPAKGQWILILDWPNAKESSFRTLEGAFRHGRGEFYAGGKDLLSRFTFSDVAPTSLRWDDAYSTDGGKTWTYDWIMEFTRTAEAAQWPGDHHEAHTFGQAGTRCRGNETEFGLVASVAGRWQGQASYGTAGDTTMVDVQAYAYRILDGCASIQFLEYPQQDKMYRSFSMLTYNNSKSRFEELRLDNQLGTTASILHGNLVDGALEMLPAGPDALGHVGPSSWTTTWRFPTDADGDLRINLHHVDGAGVARQDIVLARVDPGSQADKGAQSVARLHLVNAINATCPRSGEPIVASSLALYRGYTVGFCNQHCRDDFEKNFAVRPRDREFFDELIAGRDKDR